MNQQPLLGPLVRRFLLEHLTSERNLSRNTQRSYRDTFCLLIPLAADKLQRPVDRIKVTELSADLVRAFLIPSPANNLQRHVHRIREAKLTADLVRAFLTYLKEVRNCGTNTHNQR